MFTNIYTSLNDLIQMRTPNNHISREQSVRSALPQREIDTEYFSMLKWTSYDDTYSGYKRASFKQKISYDYGGQQLWSR